MVIVAVTLAPWLHNHTYLRDLYDYGLVMVANGRILAGERPYVDFTTPIQAGTFLPNLAAEALFGGTYVGMTWGAALATAAAALGLLFVFSRRWPAGISAFFATAIVIGSMSQHTIVWYNAIGTLCLALVAWGCAAAPVLRAQHWRWHTLVACALILGGMNKINYQLLALAFAAGWAVRERLAGRASWSRLGLTLGVHTACGTVLPVSIELAWTGATVGQWWYNVIVVPFAGRADSLGASLSWRMLIGLQHDYYGRLSLQAIGLLCLAIAVGAAIAIWKRTSGSLVERLSLFGAAVLAGSGSLALLATNYEIAYLALAAGVALGASLWLGFGAAPHGKLFWFLLGAPALLLLLAGGESAWHGQRSQFGHLTTDRTTYQDLSSVGPAYGYFSGLKIPSEIVTSLVSLTPKLPPPGTDGKRPLYWGTGLEFLDRAFPSRKYRDLPLWTAFSTSMGPKENARLSELIRFERELRDIYLANPWAYVPPPFDGLLRNYFSFIEQSFFVGHWTRKDTIELPPDSGSSGQPLSEALGIWNGIEMWNQLSCPIDARNFSVQGNLQLFPRTETEAPFLGTTHDTVHLQLKAGARALRADIVIRRQLETSAPAEAAFVVRPVGSTHQLWAGSLSLSPGEQERAAPLSFTCNAVPLEFAVTVSPAASGAVAAGFRNFNIQMNDADNDPPPRLRAAAPEDVSIPLDQARKWFPTGDWNLQAAVARGVEATPNGLIFQPGAELWIKPDRALHSLDGTLVRADDSAPGLPVLRFIWYKGVRMEMLRQEGLSSPDATINFHGWSPEPDGWFGIMIDQGTSAPAIVRFTTAQ